MCCAVGCETEVVVDDDDSAVAEVVTLAPAPQPIEIQLTTMPVYVPPGPDRLPDVPENLLGAIADGVALMHEAKFTFVKCGGPHPKIAKTCLGDYMIAAADADGDVIQIEAYEGRPSNPPGFSITCERDDGSCDVGVNPPFLVESPPGWTVVAIRTPVYKRGGGVEGAVYVPYSSRLNTPEMRQAGLEYLYDVVHAAYLDLRLEHISSARIQGSFVTDWGTPDHILTLALTEQMRSALHFDEGNDVERLEQLNRSLVILAANNGRTAYYMRSVDGAAGLWQFISKSYVNIRDQYPDAGLMNNELEGRLDHRNSVKAAILHTDDEWWAFRNRPELRDRLMADSELRREVFAAGYNTNVNNVRLSMQHCGDDWREFSCEELDARIRGYTQETRKYVVKYNWTYSILFDRDFRIGVEMHLLELEEEARLAELEVLQGSPVAE